MKPIKSTHTVQKIDKQIDKISQKLGDISPIALKAETERIEKKKAKKAAFFAKFKKKK